MVGSGEGVVLSSWKSPSTIFTWVNFILNPQHLLMKEPSAFGVSPLTVKVTLAGFLPHCWRMGLMVIRVRIIFRVCLILFFPSFFIDFLLLGGVERRLF